MTFLQPYDFSVSSNRGVLARNNPRSPHSGGLEEETFGFATIQTFSFIPDKNRIRSMLLG